MLESGAGGLLANVIFLPIAERELRVAARKRSTFWVRLAAALVALVFGCGFFAIQRFTPAFSRMNPGGGFFSMLTWIGLAMSFSAGLFLTSDCLSEEKREGTLGLLFLTELRGYDVVSGKLLATSLRAFYSLLAVLPILAVSLPLGGVTGVEFWKASLALANAMFVSLAAALFISSLSRDPQKAFAATLALLILLAVGGPACDAASTVMRHHTFKPLLTLSSPVYLFIAARGIGREPFWLSLLVNHAEGWVLFSLACIFLPRCWQERVGRSSSSSMGWRYRWKFGGTDKRLAIRRKLLSINPVLWIGCRERWQSILLWVAALIFASLAAAMFAFDRQSVAWFLWSYLAGFFSLILYLGAASQASRFFVESRRSGLLELFLVTPLSVGRILEGHWRAFIRLFGVPLAICLASQMFGTFMMQSSLTRVAASIPTVAPTGPSSTNTLIKTNLGQAPRNIGTVKIVSGNRFAAPNPFFTICMLAATMLTFLGNLAALIWFGMWMGLTSPNVNIATLKTFLFVQVIPWVVISFASVLAVPLLLIPKLMKGIAPTASQSILWFPLIMAAVTSILCLIKDIGFLLWSRKRLHSQFREQAARVAGAVLAAPPRIRPART